jgi:hypothetical protein
MTNNDNLDEQTNSEGIVTRRLDPDQVKNIGSQSQSQNQNNWQQVGEDWQTVGEEFKKLGLRLGDAIRTGWNAGQEQQIGTLQDQLRTMVDNVESAVRSARQEAASPETKAQTQRVVEATKEAQESLVDEARDLVINGLRVLNAQLRDLADRLEQSKK